MQHRSLIWKLLRLVPVCPQFVPGGGPREAQSWRGVPLSPFVPIEIAQVSAGFPSSCGQLPLGIGTLSLVCRCQISVSVRPERRSAAETTKDTGHHSRIAPRSSVGPPRHAALAPIELAAASRFIGVSPCPRAPGAPGGASADVARGVRASGRSRCTVCGFDAL